METWVANPAHPDALAAGFIGVLFGVLIWLGLLRRAGTTALAFRHILFVLVVVGALCRLAFSVGTPTLQGPDERAHFNYVKYLYEHRSFPVAKRLAPTGLTETGERNFEYQYYHPPLYYLSLVPVYAMAQAAGDNERLTVRALRFCSILLWLANVALTLKILRNLRVEGAFLKTFVVSTVCLLPTYTFLSALINNDNLLTTLGGVILCVLTRERSPRDYLVLGLLLGAALLVRLTAVMYVVAIVALLLIEWARHSASLSATAVRLALVLSVATVLFAPWLARNVRVYGDITAERVVNTRHHWSSPSQALTETQGEIKKTFWAASGEYMTFRFLPVVGVCLSYFAVVGLVYGALARKGLLKALAERREAFLLAMLIAVLIDIALTFRFALLYRQAQGRFLYPLLIPISLFSGAGIQMIVAPGRFRNAHVHVAGLFVAYSLGFTVFTLAAYLVAFR